MPDKRTHQMGACDSFLFFISEKQQPMMREGSASYVSGASDEFAPDNITWKCKYDFLKNPKEFGLFNKLSSLVSGSMESSY